MSKTPNPIDRHVGARVRMRRLMVGLSQSKLAEALEVTFQQVQKYEKGANRIGASRLQQLARVLEVPPAFFFEGAPSSASPRRASPKIPATPMSSISCRPPKACNSTAPSRAIKDPKVRKTVIDLVERIANTAGTRRRRRSRLRS